MVRTEYKIEIKRPNFKNWWVAEFIYAFGEPENIMFRYRRMGFEVRCSAAR